MAKFLLKRTIGIFSGRAKSNVLYPNPHAPKDFEKQCKPKMHQKDLPRLRLNKSAKHPIHAIAIKDIIYHMRGRLSTYGSTGNSLGKGHTFIDNKLYRITS